MVRAVVSARPEAPWSSSARKVVGALLFTPLLREVPALMFVPAPHLVGAAEVDVAL